MNTIQDIKKYVHGLVDKYSNLHKGETFLNESTGKQEVYEGFNALAGLNDTQKSNMAILYENQLKYMEDPSLGRVFENTTTASSGSYQTVQFSMVRRVYAKLLANELVSTQAMTTPSSTVFYLYPTISERKDDPAVPGRKTHAPNHEGWLNKCVISGANCPDTTFATCQALYDRYYDDSQFDHTKGAYTIIAATGGLVNIDPLTKCNVVVTGSAIPAANDGSIRYTRVGVVGFDGFNPGTSKGHQARLGTGNRGLEIDTDEFLATLKVTYIGAPVLDPYGNVALVTGQEVPYRISQRYAKSIVEYADLCDADGQLIVELDFTHPVKGCPTCPPSSDYVGVASSFTYVPTEFVFTWNKYENLEYSTEIAEVSFDILPITLSATDRKIKAKWSPELIKDANAYHSIDAEAELTAIMSQHIALEIDREILRELKNGAQWKRRWNYDGWRTIPNSQKYTQKEWNETLVTQINQIAAQIHKATLTAGASYVVVSPEVAALLDDIHHFSANNTSLEQDTFNLGMRKAGVLAGRYTVYVDPYSSPADVLIGTKGTTSNLETGFIFAPYVPIAVTPQIIDPNTGTYVRYASSRYAIKMVNAKYYGKITVDNIRTFDSRELR